MLKKALWAAIALTASLNVLAAPAIPVITSPSSGATNVERTPAFTADNIPGNANTQWLVYPEVAGHEYLGGQNGTSGLMGFDNAYQDIPYTLTTTIGGKKAAILRVYPYGKAQLLAEDNTVLALATVQPDALGNIQPAREDALIAVRTFTDAMAVSWYFKNTDTASQNFNGEFQAVFTDDAMVYILSSINDLDNSLFENTAGNMGCKLKTPTEFLGWEETPADFKSLISGIADEFSFICFPKPNEPETVSGNTLNSPNLEVINLPQITSLSPNTNTVTPDELLAASTKHIVQVRYEEAGVYSAYSAPVSFTTRAADTDYAWAYPTDVAFTANETKTLTFTLTNNGTEEGNSTIGIRLPFNVLGNVVSGTFSVKVNDGSGCPLNISAGKTTYTCSGVKVPVNGSVTVTVSLALPTTVTAIEYAIDGDYKNLPVVVTASGSGSNNTNTTTTESSSSSSGGALAWPLLLLPLLMFRRYKKAA